MILAVLGILSTNRHIHSTDRTPHNAGRQLVAWSFAEVSIYILRVSPSADIGMNFIPPELDIAALCFSSHFTQTDLSQIDSLALIVSVIS